MANDGDEVARTDRRDARDAERPHRLFGEALVSARTNAHLRRPEVAEQAGISYPMLANVESGRRRASDDIIERLAPVLGLKVDRMREIRDALEADGARFPTGNGIGSYMAGRRQDFVDLRTDDTLIELKPTDPGTVATTNWDRFLSNILVEAQRAEAMVLAANPHEAETASLRMQMTSGIIRDLGSLDDTDVAKVRGYVDGLREARDRTATAVSPATATPLILVPSEPFGPLYQWPVPEWIKATPDLISPHDLQRYVRQFRREAETSTKGRGTFRDLMDLMQQTLADIGVAQDGSWPDIDEIRVAAYIGQRLAVRISRGQRGMIEPGVWLQLAGLHVFPMSNPRRVVTLDWVFRMTLVAHLLWWENTDLQHDFWDLCIDEYARQLLLIED